MYNGSTGYTYCEKQKSIVIHFRKTFEINRLNILFYNLDDRKHDLIVYGIDNNNNKINIY